MAVNTRVNSARNSGLTAQTAGGGYTLPQQAFIPHPSLQHMATGRIADPLHNSGVLTNSYLNVSTATGARPSR